VVIVAFDSLDNARKWWDANQALFPEGRKSARVNSVLFMEGVPG